MVDLVMLVDLIFDLFFLVLILVFFLFYELKLVHVKIVILL